MATNPPITIGEIATVPAPGSGVGSAFHQTITRRVAHRFATAAARDAAYPAAGAGAGALAYTVDAKTLWLSDGASWLAAVAGVTPWTAVAFQNGWANMGAGFMPVSYRRVGDLVEMRGGMKGTASGTVAFTLPVGFRPPSAPHYYPTLVSGAAAGGYLVVATDGQVSVTTPALGQVETGPIRFSVTP